MAKIEGGSQKQTASKESNESKESSSENKSSKEPSSAQIKGIASKGVRRHLEAMTVTEGSQSTNEQGISRASGARALTVGAQDQQSLLDGLDDEIGTPTDVVWPPKPAFFYTAAEGEELQGGPEEGATTEQGDLISASGCPILEGKPLLTDPQAGNLGLVTSKLGGVPRPNWSGLDALFRPVTDSPPTMFETGEDFQRYVAYNVLGKPLGDVREFADTLGISLKEGPHLTKESFSSDSRLFFGLDANGNVEKIYQYPYYDGPVPNWGGLNEIGALESNPYYPTPESVRKTADFT